MGIVLQEYKPRRIIVFSRDELKQFEMGQKWSPKQYPCLEYMLGDIRDRNRLMRAFCGVDYVIHSAALKQVSAAECNPEEFVKTNVLGAMNIIEAALHNNVKRSLRSLLIKHVLLLIFMVRQNFVRINCLSQPMSIVKMSTRVFSLYVMAMFWVVVDL